MDIDISVLRLMEREKDLPFAVLVKAIEEALLTAYERTEGAVPGARVELNRKSGHVQVLAPELDDDGNKIYKVNGKAARMRETFILEDPSGHEVSKIQEKKLSVRDKMTIELGGTKATVHKRLIGIRDHYVIEVDGGKDLKAHGNIVDHEYEIESDGDTVATVSKKWFRVRESYGVQLAEGQNIPLILAITVCVDAMSHD